MSLLKENPWNVQHSQFPDEGTAEEKLKFLLNYAVLAPSGHNTQPWLFRVSGNELMLYADRTRALAVVDPGDRELVMSCGTALEHLLVAMRHFGYRPRVRTFPVVDDPDYMANVRLGEPHEPTMEDNLCFMAIKKRRTNRMPFEPKPVPKPELDRLCRAVEEEGVRLHVFTEPEEKQELAALIARGDRMQGADAHFRRELAAWVHPNRSQSRDGIPGYAQGVGDLLSYAGPFVVRTFNWGEGQAAHDQQLAEGSPVLLVLSTDVDTPVAWLAAGRALDRVLLLATAFGLDASYLNQPVEVEELRSQVAEQVDGRHPQLILRMGYGRPVKATPRRPVREMLTNGSS